MSRCFGKKSPTGRVITSGLSIQKWGRGTEGEVEGSFQADEANCPHQQFRIANANIDMNTGSDNFGSVGFLNVVVVGVVGVGTVKAIAPPQRYSTPRNQSIIT